MSWTYSSLAIHLLEHTFLLKPIAEYLNREEETVRFLTKSIKSRAPHYRLSFCPVHTPVESPRRASIFLIYRRRGTKEHGSAFDVPYWAQGHSRVSVVEKASVHFPIQISQTSGDPLSAPFLSNWVNSTAIESSSPSFNLLL